MERNIELHFLSACVFRTEKGKESPERGCVVQLMSYCDFAFSRPFSRDGGWEWLVD